MNPSERIDAINELIEGIKKEGGGRPSSREMSLAVTKLEEARMWLFQDDMVRSDTS